MASSNMLWGEVPGVSKPIPRLVQGGVRFSNATAEHDFVLLDQLFEAGCRAIDTARCYGSGESERVLGRWLDSRGVRDQMVIITKGADPTIDRQRVTPYDITGDLHDSLVRLKTDTIDLYLLHRDDPSVPVGPIVDVLNEHLKAGKIRAFGGSNWSHERLAEANRYAEERGLTGFAASSPNFCLAERVKEPWGGCLSLVRPRDKAALAWYEARQMPVFAWSSLGAGFFSDRFHRDNLQTFDHWLDKVCIDAYCYEGNFQRLDRAREMAREKRCSLPQIALAYVLSQPLDIYALLGCQSVEEYRENAEALAIRLEPGELRWLESGD